MLMVIFYLLSLLVAYAVFSLDCWRQLDESAQNDQSRDRTIDGMRGFLALSVVLFHSVMTRGLLETGQWEFPSDPFFSQLGSVAVSLFFMTTGYLFWGKVVRSEGRIDWTKLYLGRVFRIAPVYWIAVSGVTLIVFWKTGFEANEPLTSLIANLARWYALGFFTCGDLNGYDTAWRILAGVLWTLKYEWRFYIGLFPASVLAKRKLHLPASVLLLAVGVLGSKLGTSDNWVYMTLFALGMISASLKIVGLRLEFPDSALSVLALSILVIIFVAHPSIYAAEQAIPLGIVFFLISNGVSLFGILSSKSATRLGHISYSVYLLQGFIFFLGFGNHYVQPLVTGGGVTFWATTDAGMLLLCAVSAWIYVRIERPMIAAGHRISGLRPSRELNLPASVRNSN